MLLEQPIRNDVIEREYCDTINLNLTGLVEEMFGRTEVHLRLPCLIGKTCAVVLNR